jgi:hypothetical protein
MSSTVVLGRESPGERWRRREPILSAVMVKKRLSAPSSGASAAGALELQYQLQQLLIVNSIR